MVLDLKDIVNIEKISNAIEKIKPIDYKANIDAIFSIKKKASVPSLEEQIVKVCSSLREKGFEKQADGVEKKFVQYLKADKHLYRAIDEDAEDLIEFAHPNGDNKIAPADDELGDVETILSQQRKDIEVARKQPIGKNAQQNNLNQLKQAFSQFNECLNILNKIDYFSRLLQGKLGTSTSNLDASIKLNKIFNNNDFSSLNNCKLLFDELVRGTFSKDIFNNLYNSLISINNNLTESSNVLSKEENRDLEGYLLAFNQASSSLNKCISTLFSIKKEIDANKLANSILNQCRIVLGQDFTEDKTMQQDAKPYLSSALEILNSSLEKIENDSIIKNWILSVQDDVDHPMITIKQLISEIDENKLSNNDVKKRIVFIADEIKKNMTSYSKWNVDNEDQFKNKIANFVISNFKLSLTKIYAAGWVMQGNAEAATFQDKQVDPTTFIMNAEGIKNYVKYVNSIAKSKNISPEQKKEVNDVASSVQKEIDDLTTFLKTQPTFIFDVIKNKLTSSKFFSGVNSLDDMMKKLEYIKSEFNGVYDKLKGL